MNTNKILTTGLLSAAMMLTGCADSFLEVEPQTKTTLGEYYSTKEHVYEALVAAYAPMRMYDWNGAQYSSLNVSADVMADIMWTGASDPSDQQHWHLMENFESTPLTALRGVWDQSYQGVKRAIDVVSYLPDANMTDQDKALFEAEARVLRDFYYCQLWKFYGNIPYFTEQLRTPYLADQLKADDVYKNVIEDLEGAIDMKVLPMQWDDDNLGRVSQAMAYMLYAEMVMYQNDQARYAKALQYMQEIIASPLYDLNPSYPNIWETSGEWTKESIWEICYTDGPNGKRAYEGGVKNVGGTWLPRIISPDTPTGALADDGIDNGWGTFVVRAETYEMYADGDTRRDATCYHAQEGTYKPRYQDTGYFLNKYLARKSNLVDINGATDGNFNNNLRMYRYAETLLNAAELLVLTNGDASKAADYLNQVHHRAGLTDNLTGTVDNIIQERKLEFVGEGKRYWDLVRTGKASTTLVPDKYGYRTNTWSESKKYLPIPQNEIEAAQGNLVQNNY